MHAAIHAATVRATPRGQQCFMKSVVTLNHQQLAILVKKCLQSSRKHPSPSIGEIHRCARRRSSCINYASDAVHLDKTGC